LFVSPLTRSEWPPAVMTPQLNFAYVNTSWVTSAPPFFIQKGQEHRRYFSLPRCTSDATVPLLDLFAVHSFFFFELCCIMSGPDRPFVLDNTCVRSRFFFLIGISEKVKKKFRMGAMFIGVVIAGMYVPSSYIYHSLDSYRCLVFLDCMVVSLLPAARIPHHHSNIDPVSCIQAFIYYTRYAKDIWHIKLLVRVFRRTLLSLLLFMSAHSVGRSRVDDRNDPSSVRLFQH
jgi:hypothetical protein